MMQRAATWSERGSAAVDAGDLATAKACFLEAVKAEGRKASHRLHLAIVLEGLGEPAAAAQRLTEALRLDAKSFDAARRLASLLGRYALDADVPLDPIGLSAALRHDRIDTDVVAYAVLRHLAARGPLGDALADGRSRGWLEAARTLCLARTAPLLADTLFLDAVRSAINIQLEIELLLTALRRVLLLEVPAQRFEDRALDGFALALMQQCWANEYVWGVSAEEAERLAARPVDPAKLLAGDIEAGRSLLMQSMYRPFAETLGPAITAKAAAGIRPKALREAVATRLAAEEDERARAARLPRIGTIADATSRAVAQQYEAHPYPRWVSAGAQRESDFRRSLRGYFPPERLAFLDAPFEVLIAGCGTGKQVVQAGLEYGPNARLTAIDLSAASLGYASRMAGHFGLANIEFVQGDLQHLDNLTPQFSSRFQVIECVGVLHHMADPLQGWRTLLQGLAPGGLMRIGLYSTTARRNLTELRSDSAYPGPGCDDDALRAFRQVLLARELERRSLLSAIADFYTVSQFRDLLLHVSEQGLTIAEIERFLDSNGLKFRGFQLRADAHRRYRSRFPDDASPGSLANWAELEAANPYLFLGMYMFWCDAL
jgi:SAM-dependent methyltransferase